MNILLSSNGLTTDAIRRKFLELSHGLDKNVAIITTAAEKYKEKNRNIIALATELTTLGCDKQFVDVEFDDVTILETPQIIILTGGNPYYLLHHLKRSGADLILKEKVKQPCLLHGISAGAFALMQDLTLVDLITPAMNTVNLRDKIGLGLVKGYYLPHYDRFMANGIIKVEALDQFMSASSRRIIPINENAYIVCEQYKKEDGD